MSSVPERPTNELLAAARETGENKSAQAEPGPTTAELRWRRIDDLQTEALATPDPLKANLGVASAALMRIGFRLEQSIDGVSGAVTGPVEHPDRILPLYDMLLKVMRQFDRFVQLDQRLSSSG